MASRSLSIIQRLTFIFLGSYRSGTGLALLDLTQDEKRPATEAHNATRFQSTQMVSVESNGSDTQLFRDLQCLPQAKSKTSAMPDESVYEIYFAGLDHSPDIHAGLVL